MCSDSHVVLLKLVLYTLAWDAAMVTEELHALNSNLVVWNMLLSCGNPNAGLECVEIQALCSKLGMVWNWFGMLPW